jgi:L-asparaginase
VPTTPAARPVLVAGLGGTIAMTGRHGVVPDLSAEQLVAAVPALDGLPLEVRSLVTLPGATLTPADLIGLATLLGERLAAGAAGAVVTQGTDTIEETAYVLDLLHHGPEPIVVTGAMRNPTLAGADGPANLLAAVTVAASPHARDLGCLVVLGDQIHAAARVRKSHTSSPAAFTSPDGGPLGYVEEGRVRLVNRPATPRLHVPVPALPLPRVIVHTATLGDDGAILPLLADNADGLVIAGFGVGHVPACWLPHLEAAVQRIPVVLASRTGAGAVATATYAFPGSERDLIARGLIPSGALDPYKSRLLLQLTLAAGESGPGVRAAFSTAGGTSPGTA